MNALLLVLAGVIGLVTALVHGYLGETRLLSQAETQSELGRRALRAVFHLSTVYWLLGAIALISISLMPISREATVLVSVVATLYLIGAVGNFWLSRGRHIGWVLLLSASLLAIAGIW